MSASVQEPQYQRIANHYRDQIARGLLRPGDKLPSERALASQWRVARPTAARALQILRGQGITESRQGLGSYVANHRRTHSADPR